MRERLLRKLWYVQSKCQIQLGAVWWISEELSQVSGIWLFVVSLLCEEIWLWQLEIALSAGTNEPHNFKRRIPSIFYQYIFFKWNRNGYHYESVAISLTNFEGYHYWEEEY